VGSTFDSFLEQEGIRDEVEAVSIKRIRAWRLARSSAKSLRTRLDRSA
jgi:antitoxin HicB